MKIYLNNDLRLDGKFVEYKLFVGFVFRNYKIGDVIYKKIYLYDFLIRKYRTQKVMLRVVNAQNNIYFVDVV